MHIISGAFRGKRLWTPRGQTTRPTSAKVKEAIFQILSDDVVGAIGLDLFAGCGGLGLEALSRGAEEMIFVEHGKTAAKILRKNLTALGCTDRGRVAQEHVLRFLRKPTLRENSFDLIFADPPYRRDLLKNTLTMISDRDLLSGQGILVAERWKKDVLPECIGSLRCFLERTYGDTSVSFWRKKQGKDS